MKPSARIAEHMSEIGRKGGESISQTANICRTLAAKAGNTVMAAPRNNIRGLAATAIKMPGMMMHLTRDTEIRPKSIPGRAATAIKMIGTMISHTRGMEVRPKNIPPAAGAINTISIRRKKWGWATPPLFYITVFACAHLLNSH